MAKTVKEAKKEFKVKDFLKVVYWIFSLYYKISPVKMILLMLTQILLETRSLFYALIFAKALDEAIEVAISENPEFVSLLPYFLVLLLYFILVDGFVSHFNRYLDRCLRFVGRNEIDRSIYTQLKEVGVQSLEDPDVADLLNRSKMWIGGTIDVFLAGVRLISSIVLFVISSLIVIKFFPIFIPIVVIIALFKNYPNERFNRRNFSWQVDNTEGKRIAWNHAAYLEDPKSLGEISLVGAFSYFDNAYMKFFNWFNTGLIKIFRNMLIVNTLLAALDTFVMIFGYMFLFRNLINGVISVGTLGFQMKSLDSITSSLNKIVIELAYIHDFSVKMKDLYDLFQLQPTVKDGEIALARLVDPPKIEFKDVWFKYPRSDKYIFKGISFTIKSGENVAIVGHNGAGKTTLVRLLSRFYTPEKGEILINGTNLSDLKIDDWYKNIGVLFQDFVIYDQLTLKENIYIGKSMKPIDEDKIAEAADNADIEEFIDKLPHGYDTIMSEKFEKGTRLSGGQQQKIAIARFFYRNAPLAIFDEPTSAIDAVAEHKIFNRIYDFFNNKTVIIISHRFSTVRNADRILVMKDGKMVEQGAHKDLVALEGVYAEAYKLQAKGYQE